MDKKKIWMVLLMTTLNALAGEPPALQLLAQPRPLVIGHRGYSAFAPENTLPSFALALKAGVDLVELDYYNSRDGTPVVMHDATLDRTTDATNRWHGTNIALTGKTVQELATLDAGSWFTNGFAGTRLPTLVQAMDLIQPQGVTLIEAKIHDPATCLQLLRDRGWINRVIVQSFYWDYLRKFHDQEPNQVLGALGPPASGPGERKLSAEEKQLSERWLDEIAGTGARVVGWNKAVTAESVRAAHARGLKVWVYTINDQKQAASLLDLGVDGIITDNPAIIWRCLALRKP